MRARLKEFRSGPRRVLKNELELLRQVLKFAKNKLVSVSFVRSQEHLDSNHLTRN